MDWYWYVCIGVISYFIGGLLIGYISTLISPNDSKAQMQDIISMSNLINFALLITILIFLFVEIRPVTDIFSNNPAQQDIFDKKELNGISSQSQDNYKVVFPSFIKEVLTDNPEIDEKIYFDQFLKNINEIQSFDGKSKFNSLEEAKLMIPVAKLENYSRIFNINFYLRYVDQSVLNSWLLDQINLQYYQIKGIDKKFNTLNEAKELIGEPYYESLVQTGMNNFLVAKTGETLFR